MYIRYLGVQNYKSLRGIRLSPGELNVIVGANAAGKTNLADAIDFVSEVYRHGLEVAVARKGGYENIAHRRMRRSKGAIEIDLTVELSSDALREGMYLFAGERRPPDMRVRHRFSFLARGSSI